MLTGRSRATSMTTARTVGLAVRALAAQPQQDRTANAGEVLQQTKDSPELSRLQEVLRKNQVGKDRIQALLVTGAGVSAQLLRQSPDWGEGQDSREKFYRWTVGNWFGVYHLLALELNRAYYTQPPLPEMVNGLFFILYLSKIGFLSDEAADCARSMQEALWRHFLTTIPGYEDLGEIWDLIDSDRQKAAEKIKESSRSVNQEGWFLNKDCILRGVCESSTEIDKEIAKLDPDEDPTNIWNSISTAIAAFESPAQPYWRRLLHWLKAIYNAKKMALQQEKERKEKGHCPEPDWSPFLPRKPASGQPGQRLLLYLAELNKDQGSRRLGKPWTAAALAEQAFLRHPLKGDDTEPLAQSLHRLLNHRLPLFTTNYDTIQEDALGRFALGFETLLSWQQPDSSGLGMSEWYQKIDEAFASPDTDTGKPAKALENYIFHLHGIYYQPDTHFILQETDYAASSFRNEVIPFLTALVRGRQLVFLGASDTIFDWHWMKLWEYEMMRSVVGGICKDWAETGTVEASVSTHFMIVSSKQAERISGKFGTLRNLNADDKQLQDFPPPVLKMTPSKRQGLGEWMQEHILLVNYGEDPDYKQLAPWFETQIVKPTFEDHPQSQS